MKKNRRTTTIRWPQPAWLPVAACLLASAAGARAAGHFDVGDAGTLDAGQCQYEAWWGRTGPEPVTGLHVGPVELGLNIDRLSAQGAHSVTAGPQVKWNFHGAALSLGAVFDVARGGLGAEWALDDKVSLIAERNRASGVWTSRIGGRFSLTPLVSVDVSASRAGPRGVRGIVVG